MTTTRPVAAVHLTVCGLALFFFLKRIQPCSLCRHLNNNALTKLSAGVFANLTNLKSL